MQYTALLLTVAAATASAQVSYNATTGVYTCPASNPNGAYCAGDSLSTNIIIRCNNGVGQPGNCDDNLAGYFPTGVNYAPCWETSDTSGDAACSKNCIVEGSSGNYDGTFTLPNCTPTSSTSASISTSASGSTSPSTTSQSTTSTSETTTSTTAAVPKTTAPSNNTTTPIITAGTSGTATPVGPSGTTSATPSAFTGAAVANSASFGLSVIGLLAAYFL